MSEYVRELPDDYRELKQLNEEVFKDPDSYDAWVKLVTAVESFEGGVTRHSDPAAIHALRTIYDAFLMKYPLFFGYWKRYADAEFNISSTEAAELIYERGTASVPKSVDLWTAYCQFTVETTLTAPDKIRTKPWEILHRTSLEEATDHSAIPFGSLSSQVANPPGITCTYAHLLLFLFETASQFIGTDYHSEAFWDDYIKFEEREQQPDNVFAILERVIHIPMAHYQRFFDTFRRLAANRPLEKLLLGDDVLGLWKKEVEQEFAAANYTPHEMEIERALRSRAEAFHMEIYNRTQTEVAKRYNFEEKLKRPYYLVDEMPVEEIEAWKRYLDFEEAEGDYARTQYLYERCLVPCANYDDLWLRYARWMRAQGTNGKDKDKDIIIDENVRNIYTRAACIYCPIGRTHVRMHWANWEESKGNIESARIIHDAVLTKVKNQPAIATHWAYLELRHGGIDAAVKIFKEFLLSNDYDIYGKAWLVAEWAKMLWQFKGAPEECRQIFQNNVEHYLMCAKYWIEWLKFELAQPSTPETHEEQHDRIKHVMDDVRNKSQISPFVTKDLAGMYFEHLESYGGADAMKEWIELDREVNGPISTQHDHKRKLAINGEESTTDRNRYAENGHPGVPINDSDIRRGVSPYTKLYQDQGENPYGPNGQPAPLKYTAHGLK